MIAIRIEVVANMVQPGPEEVFVRLTPYGAGTGKSNFVSGDWTAGFAVRVIARRFLEAH
jgi:hypothetical protein